MYVIFSLYKYMHPIFCKIIEFNLINIICFGDLVYNRQIRDEHT